jgi:hypothetical protein
MWVFVGWYSGAGHALVLYVRVCTGAEACVHSCVHACLCLNARVPVSACIHARSMCLFLSLHISEEERRE